MPSAIDRSMARNAAGNDKVGQRADGRWAGACAVARQETGGLDFIYLAKTATPAGFALVLIQATLHIIERCLVDEPAKGAA